MKRVLGIFDINKTLDAQENVKETLHAAIEFFAENDYILEVALSSTLEPDAQKQFAKVNDIEEDLVGYCAVNDIMSGKTQFQGRDLSKELFLVINDRKEWCEQMAVFLSGEIDAPGEMDLSVIENRYYHYDDPSVPMEKGFSQMLQTVQRQDKELELKKEQGGQGQKPLLSRGSGGRTDGAASNSEVRRTGKPDKGPIDK